MVISIVALLISILLPALRKSRDAARDVQCLTQVRQFGIAMVSYTQAYDNYMPPYRYTYLNKGNCYWPVFLSEFLGRRVGQNGRIAKLFLCPRDPAPYGQAAGVPNAEPGFDLGYTGAGSYGGESSIMPYNSGQGAHHATATGWYRFDHRVNNGMILITDATTIAIDLRNKSYSIFPKIFWHNRDNVNTLRGDMSAMPLNADELVELSARFRP